MLVGLTRYFFQSVWLVVLGFSLLTEEIVKLSYEHRCKVLAIEHRRLNDVARGSLRMVNILEDFRNASLHNMRYFNYSPAAAPPLSHYTMRYLYFNLFLGSDFSCFHCTNDVWDEGIMEAHPKFFGSTQLQ